MIWNRIFSLTLELLTYGILAGILAIFPYLIVNAFTLSVLEREVLSYHQSCAIMFVVLCFQAVMDKEKP